MVALPVYLYALGRFFDGVTIEISGAQACRYEHHPVVLRRHLRYEDAKGYARIWFQYLDRGAFHYATLTIRITTVGTHVIMYG
jgi:hypothetical protein